MTRQRQRSPRSERTANPAVEPGAPCAKRPQRSRVIGAAFWSPPVPHHRFPCGPARRNITVAILADRRGSHRFWLDSGTDGQRPARGRHPRFSVGLEQRSLGARRGKVAIWAACSRADAGDSRNTNRLSCANCPVTSPRSVSNKDSRRQTNQPLDTKKIVRARHNRPMLDKIVSWR